MKHYFFLIFIFAHFLLDDIAFGDKLCTPISPSGRLVFRINETAEDKKPNVILDLNRDIGEADSKINLELTDNPGSYFRLNPFSKQLILEKSLDRDATNLTTLSLLLTCAYTTSNGQLMQGNVNVTILITDLNDNAPKFVGLPFIANVSRFTPVGALINISLRAVDHDFGENAHIRYRILPGSGYPPNANSYFSLNENKLILRKPLDFEQYNFIVEAEDSPLNRNERQASQTGVTVNVFDVNNNPPSFVHPSCDRLFNGICGNVDYTISIKAGLMPGIQPLAIQPNPIQAKDLDIQNIPVRYAFVNGTPSSYDNYFFLDTQSGAVSQLRPVPLGLTSQFIITIMATEIGQQNLGTTARLIVNVDSSPINQYPPVLQTSGQNGFVEENSEVGTTVRSGEASNSAPLQILVTDEDLKPGMPPATYQYILTGLGASVFAVNQGGYVYVNIPNLDADSPNPASYQLTIQAREVGTTPMRSSEPLTLTIHVLDLNDNSPSFQSQSYHVFVAPNVNQQNVIEVRAHDNDKGRFGEISYRIISVTNNGEPFFRYNRDTGFLVAITPLTAGQQYQVLIEATDGGGKSAQTVVVIDVDATATSGSFQPKTTTNNSGRINQSTPFDPTTVTTTGFNTRLNGSNINTGQISASPGSTGLASSDYNITISESASPNSMIMTLAGSLNGPVQYSILRGNEEGKFRLDPNIGVLTLASQLDREVRSSYRLIVSILTAELNNTVSINIEVLDDNDNAPKILNPRPIVLQVQHDVSNAFVGQIQAQDSDNGQNGKVIFSIIPSNQKFAINPSDGTIRTLVALNRSDSVHRFTVVAKDNGTISKETSVEITVNVVDNVVQLPFFPIGFYNVTVEEKAGPKEILRVQAVHPSSTTSPITYELRQGDPSLFVLDALSGAISTLGSLDAEQSRSHTLIVGTKENKQQSLNSTATVVVTVLDVNDWVPLFRPFSYSATITEDLPPGTPITQVTAEDMDLDPPNNIVRYQITGFGQAKQYFKIDPISGLISVAKSLQDAPKPDLILLVEAKDGGTPALSSTATVAVTLQSSGLTIENSVTSNGTTAASNPNINRPIKFSTPSSSASVSEAVTPPYFVQILSVENKPVNRQGVQCDLVSGNYADAFSISVNKEGNCELRTQGTLDREKIDQYVLNISVSSPSTTPGGSRVDYTESTIFVVDVNDNAPQFQFEPENLSYRTYFGALDGNAKEFSSIITVTATDSDLSNNGQISYSIPTNETDGKYFIVTPNGEIKNVKIFSTISEKTNMLFQFHVEARDNPVNGLHKSSMANVVINGITSANRFVMVLEGILPDQAFKYIPDMKKSLFNRTGNCRVIGYESIRESSSLAAEEKPGTELVMYAINPSTGLICRRDEFITLFDDENVKAIRGELDTYFKMQSLKPVSPVVVAAGLFSSDKWQAAEIALIVLACVIAVGAIIGILSMCYFWSRYKASRRNIVPIDRMHLYSALPKYNALLLPPSEKEYETQVLQMLQMAMPDEHEHNRQADADFSIDEGIYTIQSPNRLDLFAQHHPPSHVYIPPPDYPINGLMNGSSLNHNGVHRFKYGNGEKTTIL